MYPLSLLLLLLLLLTGPLLLLLLLPLKSRVQWLRHPGLASVTRPAPAYCYSAGPPPHRLGAAAAALR